MEENFDTLFAKIRSFGWDNNKRNRVLRERKIDFEEVRFIFDEPTIAYRSDRKGEMRYIVFGLLDGKEIAVVCTFRDDICWIISARRASRNERKKYHDRLPRRSAPEG